MKHRQVKLQLGLFRLVRVIVPETKRRSPSISEADLCGAPPQTHTVVCGDNVAVNDELCY